MADTERTPEAVEKIVAATLYRSLRARDNAVRMLLELPDEEWEAAKLMVAKWEATTAELPSAVTTILAEAVERAAIDRKDRPF